VPFVIPVYKSVLNFPIQNGKLYVYEGRLLKCLFYTRFLLYVYEGRLLKCLFYTRFLLYVYEGRLLNRLFYTRFLFVIPGYKLVLIFHFQHVVQKVGKSSNTAGQGSRFDYLQIIWLFPDLNLPWIRWHHDRASIAWTAAAQEAVRQVGLRALVNVVTIQWPSAFSSASIGRSSTRNPTIITEMVLSKTSTRGARITNCTKLEATVDIFWEVQSEYETKLK